MKQRMNVATSCDDRYAKYVFVNLANIDSMLSKNHSVHFYLMHSNISSENIAALEDYAKSLDLEFYNVVVDESIFPAKVLENSKVKNPERFYDGMCHLFLPDDIDRVLYIDAGDVLVQSEDYPIYFEDFENNSLIVSFYWNLRDDPWDFNKLQGDWGGFNSGHVVINLERLRARGITSKDYDDYVEKWRLHFPDKPHLYGGDQGFLTAFFAGEMKPSGRGVYNTKASDHEGVGGNPHSKAIHFNAMFPNLKPWYVPFEKRGDLDRYHMKFIKKGKEVNYFSKYENDCIFSWWEYCRMTPMYDQIKAESFRNRRFLISLIKETNLLLESSEKTV